MGVNVFCRLNAVPLGGQTRHSKVTLEAEGTISDGGTLRTNLEATETCICDSD